jgi:hypothetical protein
MSSNDFPDDGFDDVGYPAEEFDSTIYPQDEPEAADAAPLQPDLESMTVDQLKQHAADWGIDLGSAKKHGAILRIIRSEMEPSDAERSEPDEPVAPGLDLSTLYEHVPPAFTEALTKALHARGLVEPGDYFKPGAAALFRSAMLGVIKKDFLSAQALAKKVWVDNAGRKRGK